MIALISFDEDLVLLKEEAIQLNLNYVEGQVAYSPYYEKKKVFGSHDHFMEDLEKVIDPEDSSKVKYVANGKEIAYYYLFDRIPNAADYVIVKKENHLVNLETFVTSCRYRFHIEKAIRSESPSVENIQNILLKIEERASQIDKTINILNSSTFNQKVNVHVGGGLITTYNELLLKEDVCTDLLQTELNNGWRIIAVCVQPNNRRPDYILGRFNPKLDVTEKTGASR